MIRPEKEIPLGMTNFDGSIDEGLEEALRKEKCFGRHTGWNFNGRVWWDDEFYEEVWVFGSPQEIMSAETLEKLMEQVNRKYGDD